MKTRILMFATLFLFINKKVKSVHVYAQAEWIEVVNLFQWYSLVVDVHTIWSNIFIHYTVKNERQLLVNTQKDQLVHINSNLW